MARRVVIGDLRVQQIDRERWAAVVDDRVAGRHRACRGGPVPARARGLGHATHLRLPVWSITCAGWSASA